MSENQPPPGDDPGTPPTAGGTPPPDDPPPPPPPSGGSQWPPPPPPPQAWAPPSGAGGYSPADAIGYGWKKFTKSPSTLLVPALVVIVAVIVLEVIIQLILRSTILDTHDCTQTIFGQRIESQCGPSFFITVLGTAIAGLVVSMVAQMLGAGLIKSALNVVDGQPVSTGDVFSYATRPEVVTTAAIVSVATFIGTLLCYLPGLIVGFLTAFSMFYVVDKGMSPVEAVKASIAFTTGNLGPTILFYLLGIVVVIVGAVLCLVGLLAAIPVVLAGAAYTFRMLNNEPVTPAEG